MPHSQANRIQASELLGGFGGGPRILGKEGWERKGEFENTGCHQAHLGRESVARQKRSITNIEIRHVSWGMTGCENGLK